MSQTVRFADGWQFVSSGGSDLPIESVHLAVRLDSYTAVHGPELVLLDQQRHRSLEDTGVIGVIDVCLDHGRQKWRLGSVQVVLPGAIGNETKPLDKIQEVLNDIPRDLGESAASAEKTLDDPV